MEHTNILVQVVPPINTLNITHKFKILILSVIHLLQYHKRYITKLPI